MGIISGMALIPLQSRGKQDNGYPVSEVPVAAFTVGLWRKHNWLNYVSHVCPFCLYSCVLFWAQNVLQVPGFRTGCKAKPPNADRPIPQWLLQPGLVEIVGGVKKDHLRMLDCRKWLFSRTIYKPKACDEPIIKSPMYQVWWMQDEITLKNQTWNSY